MGDISGIDLLKPLSDEELAKVEPPTEEEIRQALEKGRKDAEACAPGMFAKKGCYCR